MKIQYEYKGSILEFSTVDINKSESAFKVSLKRKLNISINEYLKYLGFEIEKCRVCKVGHPPICINYLIEDNFIKIKSFSYKKKIYCYDNNPNCFGKKLNPNSFEFISLVNNISIEDAKKFLKENNKSPFYRENHKSEVSYKKSQSRSLQYYIEKHGEDEGVKRYQTHVDKISFENSLDGYIKKYGESIGAEIFKSISLKKDSMSFKFFLKKNEGEINAALKDFNDRKKSVDISVKNLIEKYGEEIALKKHQERIDKSKNTFENNPNKTLINKSRAISIEKFFKKYGSYEIAKSKYEGWKVKVTVPICRASKESLVIFEPLINILIEEYNIEYEDMYIGYKEKSEFFLKKDNNIYFYDFTIRSKKIIIEYNGILFHPKTENSIWTNPFNKGINSEIAFKRQELKIKTAKENGFKVFEIWSDEHDNLNKCLNFIKNNI
jgi:hypothetical protein